MLQNSNTEANNPALIPELIEAMGWTPIPNPKNQYMWSYSKGKRRLNFYFTTRTVTIQKFGEPIITIRDATPERIEANLT